MFDSIPLEYYSSIYLNVCLFITIVILVHAYLLPLDDKRNLVYLNFTGLTLFFSITCYLGLRPLSEHYFGDMLTYAKHFQRYAEGGEVVIKKDVFFHYFMKISSSFLTLTQFFLLCAILYISPMYLISKRYFKEYWFFAFFVFVISFQFLPYGTNGIRNGIATSLFLLGAAFSDRKYLMYPVFLIAVLFHSSLLLPIVGFTICYIYNKPKLFLYGWLATIPVSIAFGSFFETLLVASGLGDDRLETYLTGTGSQGGGFRYDFLLYSSSAVFTGWYFIFRRNFVDKLYNQLYNTYLLTNAFWILVIRANFSNRFAYLSWFMIGLIIIYPFLKQRFYERQHIAIGWVIVAYFSFTYFMSFVYYAFIK